jgi:hypothetical protein
MYTLGSTCGLVAPLAFGILADTAGIPVTMVVLAGMILLTLPLCFVLGPALNEVDRARPAE